ncbi:sorting nexin 2A [Perilla frutescens var. frutescens]|nr:sorting nexin 2A [Perilla frutescens var. frutescens]
MPALCQLPGLKDAAIISSMRQQKTDVASRMLDGAVRLLLGGSSLDGGVADTSEVTQPAKGGRYLLRIFKELKQSVANDWGGAKPPLVEDDKMVLDRKEKFLQAAIKIPTPD